LIPLPHSGIFAHTVPSRITIPITNTKAINWAFLQHEAHFMYRRIADRDRAVLAIGVLENVISPSFNKANQVTDWTFGAMRYEWKDALEPDLRSAFPSSEQLLCSWTVPRFVVEWVKDEVVMHVPASQEDEARSWAKGFFSETNGTHAPIPIVWTEDFTREQYLAKVEKLLEHIHRGDIYEVNFCTARRAKIPCFDPFRAFERLLESSAAPFAGFYRNGDRFALCASPERFLEFDHDKVIGQPMKGTRPRHSDPMEDQRLALELAVDEKERSENIMALDVMRNDLARIAASGSVKVDELCAVISFPRVHQMISTVSATLRSGTTPFDAIAAAFPMASMTGAPKFRAMQLIEEAEGTPRGLFSGSLGFFAPDGTADFNVVIRTLMYDANSSDASIHTGSAITSLCDPEMEWQECQLKARSVIDALAHA